MKFINRLAPLLVTVQDSVIFTGTQNLLSDVSKALLIILPLLAIAFLVYLAIRKVAADPQEKEIWSKRMWGVGIALAIGLCASGIVTLVTSYYQ